MEFVAHGAHAAAGVGVPLCVFEDTQGAGGEGEQDFGEEESLDVRSGRVSWGGIVWKSRMLSRSPNGFGHLLIVCQSPLYKPATVVGFLDSKNRSLVSRKLERS